MRQLFVWNEARLVSNPTSSELVSADRRLSASSEAVNELLIDATWRAVPFLSSPTGSKSAPNSW